VGSVGQADGTETTLVEHWNGSQWALGNARNPGAGTNRLYGVETLAGQAWAVGFSSAHRYRGEQALLEHKVAGHPWALVQSPIGRTNGELDSISGSSPSDVWMVANHGVHGLARSVTAHWDGSSWTRVPSGAPGVQSVLLGVSDRGAQATWAVGESADAGGTAATLREIWNDTRWVVR
jgi:hypothetical protein